MLQWRVPTHSQDYSLFAYGGNGIYRIYRFVGVKSKNIYMLLEYIDYDETKVVVIGVYRGTKQLVSDANKFELEESYL